MLSKELIILAAVTCASAFASASSSTSDLDPYRATTLVQSLNRALAANANLVKDVADITSTQDPKDAEETKQQILRSSADITTHLASALTSAKALVLEIVRALELDKNNVDLFQSDLVHAPASTLSSVLDPDDPAASAPLCGRGTDQDDGGEGLMLANSSRLKRP